uniref:Archease domain-containing protein n=1 Tax=Panagrolaimus sp. PS1159 TaxID=55785 RepID=A0AC35FAT0_9BILA
MQKENYMHNLLFDDAYTIINEAVHHTADVQLHSWAQTFEKALEQLVVAFYGTSNHLETVKTEYSMDIKETEHDRESMIHSILEECLYLFDTEPFFIGRKVEVIRYNSEKCEIKIRAFGELFDKTRDPSGTAVKAIKYSTMQIHDNIGGKVHIYVIVDI